MTGARRQDSSDFSSAAGETSPTMQYSDFEPVDRRPPPPTPYCGATDWPADSKPFVDQFDHPLYHLTHEQPLSIDEAEFSLVNFMDLERNPAVPYYCGTYAPVGQLHPEPLRTAPPSARLSVEEAAPGYKYFL